MEYIGKGLDFTYRYNPLDVTKQHYFPAPSQIENLKMRLQTERRFNRFDKDTSGAFLLGSTVYSGKVGLT